MTAADRPVCEGADDAFLPAGADPGPCTDDCPKHGAAVVWTVNTGYWEDGAASSVAKPDGWEMHVRQEGADQWWWRLLRIVSEAGMEVVDEGTSPTAGWAQAHAEAALARVSP